MSDYFSQELCEIHLKAVTYFVLQHFVEYCQVLGSGTEKIWDLVTYILLFALVLLILAITHVR